MNHPRIKVTKVQDRLIYRKREGRKGNLLPFVSIHYFLSSLLYSGVVLIGCGSVFPELPGESLKSRTRCSFFMHLWQGCWVELCRLVIAQGWLAEEWLKHTLSRRWAPRDCHTLRESTLFKFAHRCSRSPHLGTWDIVQGAYLINECPPVDCFFLKVILISITSDKVFQG